MLTRKRSFPFTVEIEGHEIQLLIRRMTVPEFVAFEARFIQMGEGRGAPQVPDDKTAPVSREQLDDQVAYYKTNAEWRNQIFEQFVSVLPGQVTDEDDEGHPVEVTNGQQLANMFPGDDAFVRIILEIYLLNRLSEEQKKKLQSRFASGIGSSIEPSPAAPGETPAPAATSADNEDSARLAAAMAAPSDASSGMTVRSSSEAVPSGI